MMTRTHHVNQVIELTSQLTSTKYKLVKHKELFHSSEVARRRVVDEEAPQKEKIKSYINYLNIWLMEMAE